MRPAALALQSALVLALAGCGGSPEPAPPPPPPDLEADYAVYAEEFRQGVFEVTDGVHVAIGFGLANAILLEGENGVVVVDAMESRPRAEAVLAAFREVTDKPVRALILTHNHADHVFGGQVFTELGEDIPVYAHADLEEALDEIVSVVRETIFVRSMRMFGQMLPEHARADAGIGVDLDFRMEDIALARPTHTFTDRLELEIEGLRIELIHTPGETDDQLAVWLPEKRVLLPADNIYRAFPNLYTIRGTTNRDVMAWVRSLDLMRDLGAAHLVPSHTRPVSGEDAIAEVLTTYRDAIQYVHDQTVRGLNQGKTPDELAWEIRLPPHLEEHPFLRPYYGTVPFSVRGIANGYMGWFDGDAARLEPLHPDAHAQRMFEGMATGVPLPDQARAALDEEDFRWAAYLARQWVRHLPEDGEARETLAAALEQLAEASLNFNARNYYTTQAMEWRGEVEITPGSPAAAPDDFIDTMPVEQFLAAMTVRLKAEETLDMDQALVLRFTDTGQDFTIHIRRGVAEIRERKAPDADLTVTTTANTWKRLASRKVSPARAFIGGDVRVEGGIPAVIRFLGHFEQ